MLQLYSNIIESYNFLHVHHLWLFGSHVIRVVTSFKQSPPSKTGREDPQCSHVFVKLNLNLSTEHEDTMHTYLGNLLNIIMEHHLKLYRTACLVGQCLVG